MINWERIAEILTRKWLKSGHLPIYKDGEEYDFIFPTNFTGFPGDELRYATQSDLIGHDGRIVPSIKASGQISRSQAMREVWTELTPDEKTAIMTDTLGAHVHSE